MCHEQWALTVIKLLRFFVLIVNMGGQHLMGFWPYWQPVVYIFYSYFRTVILWRINTITMIVIMMMMMVIISLPNIPPFVTFRVILTKKPMTQ